MLDYTPPGFASDWNFFLLNISLDYGLVLIHFTFLLSFFSSDTPKHKRE